MLVDTTKVKSFITEPNLEVELRPLLLFKGGLTTGQAKARFNFLRTAMEAELPTVKEITAASSGDNDVAHLCGLHAKWGWQRQGVLGFFSRVLQSPTVLKREPRLSEYIHWVAKNSPRAFIYPLNPIPETNVWSTRDWRRPPKAPRKQREQMAEFYPFITTTPTEDHELLLAVDRLVPKNVSADVRADLCQDMIVSLLLGEISLENLKDSTPQFVKRLWKEMPSKYGQLSLDAPLVFGEGKTIGDTIAAEFG